MNSEEILKIDEKITFYESTDILGQIASLLYPKNRKRFIEDIIKYRNEKLKTIDNEMGEIVGKIKVDPIRKYFMIWYANVFT